ncbi:MAG: hypothetical protein IJA10_08050 [Lachnospiraceae bacterium]|nr:hypothetical protein [Lachnospiraceae bacterium]
MNFEHSNGNRMPGEEAEDSVDEYGVNYIDGVEVTDEECAKYDLRAYEYIFGSMSYEEMALLSN